MGFYWVFLILARLIGSELICWLFIFFLAAAGFGANLSVASVATSPTAVVMATAPSSAESRDPIKREEAQSDVNHSNPKKPIDQHRVRSIELDPVGFP